MPEFKVNTDELVAGRGHHHMIAGAIGESAGILRAAAGAVAESAGHPGACAAGADWGVAWEGHLVGHADALRQTGDNLAAAAHAYRETDGSQMRT
jgi:hypothetical protein